MINLKTYFWNAKMQFKKSKMQFIICKTKFAGLLFGAVIKEYTSLVGFYYPPLLILPPAGLESS